MKKFTKICLITSMILVIVGCGGIGAGFAMGLTPAQLLYLVPCPSFSNLWEREFPNDLECPFEDRRMQDHRYVNHHAERHRNADCMLCSPYSNFTEED